MKTNSICKYTLTALFLFVCMGVKGQELKLTLTVQPYELHDFLGSQKDLVTDLTLIGSINAYDIGVIRDMAKLTKLNIANVKLVPGGSFMGISVVTDQVPTCMFFSLINLTSVILPTNITAIGSQAFQDCKSLTSIIVPNGITVIDHLTFANCVSLTSVSLPDKITEISDYAFWNCTALPSLTIPASVTTIGRGAFAICTNLKEFIVPETNIAFSSVEGVLFNKSKSVLIAYPNSKSAFYTTPASTTSIADYAFQSCYGLGMVVIDNNVTSLGEGAFYNCTGLYSVVISNNISSIKTNTFYDCNNLISVSIPNSVTSIGWEAFGYCYRLTSIDISSNLTSIDIYAFTNCSALTVLTLPKSTTFVNEWAFNYCTGLTQLHSKALAPPKAYLSSFNAIDVTTCGLYVPKGTSTLYKGATGWSSFKSIIEEYETAIPQAGTDSIKVYTEQNSIIIEGAGSGNIISVYDVSGKLFKSIKVTDNVTRIYVPVNHIYLVNIATKVFKVAL